MQPELAFTPPPPPPDAEVATLINYLLARPGFHTAATIARTLNLTDRRIRHLAEAANGLIVSGPGAPGYIHLHHCPAEDLSHIAESLISQGRAMISRGLKTRRLAHAIIR